MKSYITMGWVVALLIALVMGSYFYYHIHHKTSELKSHGIGELDNMVKNILEKRSEYSNMTEKLKYLANIQKQPWNIYTSLTDHLQQNFETEIDHDPVPYSTPIVLSKNQKGYLKFDTLYTDFSEFLRSLRRNDFFEEMAIMDLNFNKVYYESKNNLIGTWKKDSAFWSQYENKLGVRQGEVEISGKTYMTFSTPFKIGSNQYQIIGFKDLDDFQSEARQISPFLLNNAFLFLLFILVCIPIIRIYGMGKGDYLTQIHVLEIGFGILALSFVFSFGLGFYSNYTQVSDSHKTQLKRISDFLCEKSNTYFIDLNTKLVQLANNTAPEKIKDTLEKDSTLFNEFIQSNSSHDSMTVYLSPQFVKEKLERSLIDISTRDYHQAFQPQNLESSYTINHLSQSSIKDATYNSSNVFFLGSHYSYVSGNFEGVVSKSELDTLSVLTFNFIKKNNPLKIQKSDSVCDILNLNDQDYQSMIIRKDGKILHHSITDKRWVNLFDEIDDEEVQEEIESFIASQENEHTTTFTYGNVDCNVIIKALRFQHDKEKLFYHITYQDQNITLIQSTTSMTSTMIFILWSLSLLAIMAGFMYLGNYRSERISYSSFPYKWFRPSAVNSTGHLQNIILIGFHLVSYWVVSTYVSNNVIFYLLLFTQSISVISLFRYLNITITSPIKTWFNHPKTNWVFIIGSLFLILFFSGSLLSIDFSGISEPLFIHFAIQVTGVVISFYSRPFLKKLGGTSISKSSQIFVFSSLVWLITVSFVPTIIYQNTVSNMEMYLWTHRNDIPLITELKTSNASDDDFSGFVRKKLRFLSHMIQVMDKQVPTYHHAYKSTFNASLTHNTKTKPDWVARFTALVCIIILFFLLKSISNRLFLTHLMKSIKLRIHHPPLLTNQTFCIGLPFSGRSQYISKLLVKPSKKREYNFINLSEVENFQRHVAGPKFDENLDGIHIRNMDNLIYDFKSFHIFLDTLGQYNMRTSTKLVIYSHSTIDELIDRINDSAESTLHKEALINKITYLFTSFATIIVPLKATPLNWRTTLMMANEFRYGPNIRKLHEYGQKMTQNQLIPIDQEENIILKVNEFNYAYYLTIWNTLTIWEKHIIYDYAKNGYLNYANLEKIELLCRKGVLQINNRDHQIELFNHSFGQFVSGILNQHERQVFKNIHRKEGNWSTIRIILLFIVGSIILFLYLTDPNIINKSLGIISIVTSSMFALVRMYKGFSSFNFLKNSQANIID